MTLSLLTVFITLLYEMNGSHTDMYRTKPVTVDLRLIKGHLSYGFKEAVKFDITFPNAQFGEEIKHKARSWIAQHAKGYTAEDDQMFRDAVSLPDDQIFISVMLKDNRHVLPRVNGYALSKPIIGGYIFETREIGNNVFRQLNVISTYAVQGKGHGAIKWYKQDNYNDGSNNRKLKELKMMKMGGKYHNMIHEPISMETLATVGFAIYDLNTLQKHTDEIQRIYLDICFVNPPPDGVVMFGEPNPDDTYEIIRQYFIDWWILILLCTVLTVILIFIGIFCCIRCRNKKRKMTGMKSLKCSTLETTVAQ